MAVSMICSICFVNSFRRLANILFQEQLSDRQNYLEIFLTIMFQVNSPIQLFPYLYFVMYININIYMVANSLCHEKFSSRHIPP